MYLQTQNFRNTLADFANTSITKQLGTQFKQADVTRSV